MSGAAPSPARPTALHEQGGRHIPPHFEGSDDLTDAPAVPPPFSGPRHDRHRGGTGNSDADMYDEDHAYAEHEHNGGLQPDLLASRFGAIVLLEVSYVEPEYLRPWQKTRQGSCAGTGFAIPDTPPGGGGGGSSIKRRRRRILTNMHVVQDATDIRVRKHGHSRRWRAAVVCKGPDVDLAVLEIVAEDDAEIDAFWDGVSPIQWAADDEGGTAGVAATAAGGGRHDALPLLQSPVNVVGYPTGGRTICVTEGVVSRIDCRNYRLKTAGAAPGKLLVIQIDAAINAGNSGGPCFDDEGKVVGVAFQGLEGESAQNVGYIIPTDVALNFLHAIEDEGDDSDEEEEGGGDDEEGGAADASPSLSTQRMYRYRGVQEIPFRWAPLQNKSLRKYLKFNDRDASGVVVTKVSPLAAARHASLHSPKNGDGKNNAAQPPFLREEDVITHIDGRSLGDDYTVSLRGDELMNADFLITGKRRGEPTTFDVIRDSKPLRIETTLSPLSANVPREHGVDCAPDWLVVGGLLFVPLTCPLLSYGTTEDLESSGYLKIYDYMDEELSKYREEEGTETCLLIDICACDTNFGYDFRQSWRVLESVNGEAVKNMAHLYNIYLDACQSMQVRAPSEEEEEEEKTPFLIFKFKNKSRIVLETNDCVTSEKEVLEQHGIPKAVSSGVFRRAAEERRKDKG